MSISSVPHADVVGHRMHTLFSVFVAGKPVSVNVMYGHAGRRHYLTRAAREWEDSVAYTTLPWRLSEREKTPPPQLVIFLTFYGMRANSDVDNLCKATFDGLKVGLNLDDRYFISVSAWRGQNVTGDLRHSQGAQITVYRIDE